MKSVSPVRLADYLADREGLTGTARHRFLVLVQVFVGSDTRRPSWPALAILLPLPATWVLIPHHTWVSVFFLTSALILYALRRSPPPIDPHAEWRTYCVLLRPVLLAKHPGLLDRNLPADQSATDSLRPLDSWWEHLRHFPGDFWRGGVVGIWIATAILLIRFATTARVSYMDSTELFVLGFVVVGATWSFVRWWIFRLYYRRAQRLR